MSKVCKKTVDTAKQTVTFEFADGAGTLVLPLAELSTDIQSHLALHGVSQKVGDSFAGAKDAAEAFGFAQETIKDLTEGKWTSRVASSGPKISLLAEGVAQVMGIIIEDATTKIKALPEEKVKALRKNAKVVAAMAALKAQRAAAKAQETTGVDVGSLLS